MKVEVSDEEYEVIKALRRFRNSVEEAIKDEILEVKSMKILTEDERVILKNLSEEYTKIARTDMNNLQIKGETLFVSAWIGFAEYNHLFQFIKERRRIFY